MIKCITIICFVSTLFTPNKYAFAAKLTCGSLFINNQKQSPISQLAVEINEFDAKAILGSSLDLQYQQWKAAQGKTLEPTSFTVLDQQAGMEIWVESIKKKSSDWFRGMFFHKNGQELIKIAKEGFPENSQKTYFAKDPKTAMDYTRVTWARQPIGPQLRVLFQVGKEARVKKEDGWDEDFGVTTLRILPSEIKKIYIFDKNGPVDFPFIELTPEELIQYFN